ncbi:4-hydroxyphenylacetate 3-hydroxylase family protein [Streptomyces sp. 4N509B]|uniref:4-hydroxyphenylacetate 3-hydroxylase family protein n=1 Tax=Streptomyces sp. 4N509B TaxID=3457413 RepID=UPI003FD252A6
MTRTGAEYRAGLADGRQVFLDGEVVTDLASHPATRGVVASVSAHYDHVADPAHRAELTYPSPTTGQPVNLSHLIPRGEDDLRRRRVALRHQAELSYGLIGRGPEHMAGFLAGWAGRSDVFAAGGAEYARNIVDFYEHVRDNDLYCTYAIVPPQIDRGRPPSGQSDPRLYAGVVGERDGGIVVSGAQMLGTASAICDYIVLTSIVPLGPGDEDHALSVAVPPGAPGVRIHSRRGYAAAASSVFDYPLSSRFDETDALIVLDEVFVPWERVFVYRDLDVVSRQWNHTPAHLLGNNQAQIRLATKLDLMAGVAERVTRMNNTADVPSVRVALGEITSYAAMVAGLVYGQEQNCEIDDHGVAWPGRAECFATLALQSDFYPRLVHLLRELCGGGLIQLPSSARDFAHPQTAADLARFVQSPGFPSQERVRLLKLAWDLVGSEFAGRHTQYELFYAGAPHVVRARMAQVYDFERAGALVDRALAGYGLTGPEPAADAP